MPAYELAILLRQMTKPEVISTMKRAADSILDKGGVIRKLESLGTKPLPHKISAHGQVHKTGNYFIIQFDTAPNKISELKEEYGRDIDIIRRNIFRIEEEPIIECTLHEELLPPAYRREVQDMIKQAQKKQKTKFKYNSGLNYYPFQK